MSGELHVRNRQRTQAVNLRLLRQMTLTLLKGCFQPLRYDLGVCLVDAREMARLNETFLNHAGSTDVITFSYSDCPVAEELHGEIFICLDVARTQARRFQTSWQKELARYLIHGLLHLQGYDDLRAAPRRVMKREENRRLRELAGRFALSELEPASKVAA